jgi:arginine/lysine/ornithine decarboxylase
MEKDLLETLTEYADKDYYPFHMPGHKRNVGLCEMGNPYCVDITEIDGFDNLHDARGILKEAMEEAAEICGAQETFFLVNGSSCGILAAVLACTNPGDEILIARNCHKSAYHALYLQNLVPHYLFPQTEQGIQSEILPEDVERELQKYPEIRAVMLVSPTYEGVVSDIEAIAKITHKFGCPLIVDEAHGAHFGFAKGFPETSLHLGADLVIQSVHKTLPSFTQTALLHIGKQEDFGKEERNIKKQEAFSKEKIIQPDEKKLPEQIGKNSRIDRERLCRYLSIFQTSSPSYLFMAAIQKSLRIVKEKGEILFSQLLENIENLKKETQQLQYIHILSLKNADPGKLIIAIDKNSQKTGHWLYQELLEKYHLQMEMESLSYVLAMTSIADTKEGFERLSKALQEIDSKLEELKKEKKSKNQEEEIRKKIHTKNKEEDTQKKQPNRKPPQYPIPHTGTTIRTALDSPKEKCLLDEAENHISADYIYLYPPGIPLLVPGEIISKEIIFCIKENLISGLEVKGILGHGNVPIPAVLCVTK